MPSEAQRRIASAGRALCRLDCLAGNAKLRTYYEAAGYTVVGEQVSKAGNAGST
ncbi:hypothetical protein [Streptomyces sp. NPDC006368]|uniref:hypothetical protein n=1 Tax=Streptomyces sp. NPDC006368 TaxID=3156760 RepID=UPI00339FA2D1